MPEPSAFEVELAIGKLKSHKSPGIDQIPTELIKAGVRTIRCAIHKLIISIWNKEELPEECKKSIKQSQDGTAFHPDSAWKRPSRTYMKLTSAECTVFHLDSAWKRSSKNLHETYQCRVYSIKLLMMGRETARNM